MGAATAQVILDTNSTIRLSFAVGVFESIPRWPSSFNSFQFTFDYIQAVLLSALIPLFSGLAVSILLCIHIIIRFTCRRRPTDARFHKLNRSKRWTIIQALISYSLFLIIFTCVSIGVLGNAGLKSSAQDALDTLDGLLADVRRTGLALVDIALLLRKRLEQFKTSGAAIPPELSENFDNVFEKTLDALQSYALSNFPELENLKDQVEILATNISTVLEDVRMAISIVYAVLLAIILILTFAPLLLHAGHWVAMTQRLRPGRIVFYILYMILVGLAWLLVGAFSGVGIAVADVCRATHDYRTILLRGDLDADTQRNNPLISSGFVCPTVINPDELVNQINDTGTSIIQNELATKTIGLLLNTSALDVKEASDWSGSEVRRYVDCSALIDFSGKLEFTICGEDGQSTIEGIYDLWIAFVGLAIFLMIGLFISLLGFNMARWFNVTRTGVVHGWNTTISGKFTDNDRIDADLNPNGDQNIEADPDQRWRSK